ncbi:MAG: DNA-3-methyladenine glycosylase I [Pelosinus sp.]|nr:DNA-3-methyladenine glycosylase I [Pelosinus sp.]
MTIRCEWCGDDPLYIQYHDTEWGRPQHDDQKLFEFLLLEGAQAGLSWITILRKRAAYREAFQDFDYHKVALFDQREVDELMQNAGIVRNKRKLMSAVQNARAYIKVIEEFGSFDAFFWRYTDGRSITNCWRQLSEVPVQTKLSEEMSKDLKRRGFNFVGPTICYAFMQAVGMVNDHTTDCFRHAEIAAGQSK